MQEGWGSSIRGLLSDEPLWRGPWSRRGLDLIAADPLGPSIKAGKPHTVGTKHNSAPDVLAQEWAGEQQHRQLVNVCGVCVLAVVWWSLMGCTEGVVDPGFRPGCTFPIDDDVHSLASRDEALTAVFYLPALLIALGMRMRGCKGRLLDSVNGRLAGLVVASCYFVWLWPDHSSAAGVSPLSNHCWLLIALGVFRASCSLLIATERDSKVRRLAVLPLAVCMYLSLCIAGALFVHTEIHVYQVTSLVFLAIGLQVPTGLLGKTWPIAVQVFVSLGLFLVFQMLVKAPSFIQAYIGQSLMVAGTADTTALSAGIQIGAFIRELIYGCTMFLGLLIATPSHYFPVISELGLDAVVSWCLIPFTINVGRSAWRVYFLRSVRPLCHNLAFEFISYCLTVLAVGVLVAIPPTRFLMETVSGFLWACLTLPLTCMRSCLSCCRTPR